MDHERYHLIEDAFIAGFRAAPDKLGFLALAGIPLELANDGTPSFKLLEVVLEDVFEVGRASPGFGSRELVYHPLPGKLVTSRTCLKFRYVSAETMRELSFAEIIDSQHATTRHQHR
jgi:hypothetical protein